MTEHNGIISKGTKLSWDKSGAEVFVALTDLQEVPELGGERDAVEVTTLDDEAHVYTDGLISYGDSVPFKFLYAKEQFSALSAAVDTVPNWQVTLPDSTTITFKGKCSVKLDSVAVGAPLTYTLAIKPNSKMVIA